MAKAAAKKPIGGLQAVEDPNAVQPIDAGGSARTEPANDFPSLPPGAVPPPGYVDPVSGKSAGMSPVAPAAAPVPAPAAPAAPAAAPIQAPAGQPDLGGAYKTALMGMLGTPAASLSDPALKAQSDAYAVGQARSAERAREAAAERLAGQGLASSGAMDGEIAGILERQGENEAGFNAQLVGDELRTQRDRLLQAAALAGNTLDAEQARALEERLALLDAQLKREGLAQEKELAGKDLDLRRFGIESQNDLGGRDLSLRDKLGSAGINANLFGMLQQNDQFGKSLSADMGKYNQDALLRLLGLAA